MCKWNPLSKGLFAEILRRGRIFSTKYYPPGPTSISFSNKAFETLKYRLYPVDYPLLER
tara:strand:- start:3109 stop:3285 length:177 start_codon:yes stop_codon:yes gene_type:complete